jgi:hypothetical protein
LAAYVVILLVLFIHLLGRNFAANIAAGDVDNFWFEGPQVTHFRGLRPLLLHRLCVEMAKTSTMLQLYPNQPASPLQQLTLLLLCILVCRKVMTNEDTTRNLSLAGCCWALSAPSCWQVRIPATLHPHATNVNLNSTPWACIHH